MDFGKIQFTEPIFRLARAVLRRELDSAAPVSVRARYRYALSGTKLSEDKICGETAGRFKFESQSSNLQEGSNLISLWTYRSIKFIVLANLNTRKKMAIYMLGLKF